MSLTALVWIGLFIFLAFKSLSRPVFAAHAYLMTFFASPVFWWFGGGLTSLTMRWNLISALLLMVANMIAWRDRNSMWPPYRRFFWLVALISINAFFVNLFLANYPPESNKVFDILWKGCLASGLVLLSLRNQKDLELFLFAIVVGCGFVGYEVVLAGQGTIDGGRLEGFRFPGAQGANGGAAVLSMGLVLSSYFIITMKNKLYAGVSLLLCPLILETVLRCNSRGCYLGLISSAIVLLMLSRGKSRRHALALCGIGSVAIFVLAGNAAIWERFASIFSPGEARDGAAASRLLYWEAAVKMIADYPFGSGGEAAFTSPRGVTYIAHFRPEFRSVHNGVFDIAAGWGLQGLLLYLIVLSTSALTAFRASIVAFNNGNSKRSLLGTMLLAVFAGQFVCAMFTSVLDGEWFLWLAACCLVYARSIAREQDEEELDQEMEDELTLESEAGFV